MECCICNSNDIDTALISTGYCECVGRFHTFCLQQWYTVSTTVTCPYCRTVKIKQNTMNETETYIMIGDSFMYYYEKFMTKLLHNTAMSLSITLVLYIILSFIFVIICLLILLVNVPYYTIAHLLRSRSSTTSHTVTIN